MSSTVRDVHAVLQAGGTGQRVRALAGGVPKPLLRVGGTPMAERLLRQLIGAGIRRATVITGWRAEQVEDHLTNLDGLPAELDLSFIHEPEPRGNVGSLLETAQDDAPLLLCFADLVTDLDFGELVRVHTGGTDSVTLTSHWESHRLRLGEIHAEGERVTDYREKPEKRFLICSGIGIFEAPVARLIPADRPTGLSQLVRLALAHGHPVSHWVHGAFWMDVNSPAELEQANRELAHRR